MDQSHPMKTINKDSKPYVSVINEGNMFSLQNHVDRKVVQLDKSCIDELISILKSINDA